MTKTNGKLGRFIKKEKNLQLIAFTLVYHYLKFEVNAMYCYRKGKSVHCKICIAMVAIVQKKR